MARHFGLGHLQRKKEDVQTGREESCFEMVAIMLLSVTARTYEGVRDFIKRPHEQPRPR
jgi:hypothetical protein